MINFLIALFFAGAMVCLLALPLVVTFFFVRGHDWASRKKYLFQFVGFLAAFLLCLVISGRIYDASLTPEQRSELSQETLTVTEETASAR